jgi:epoxyqueuosine reductase QueG
MAFGSTTERQRKLSSEYTEHIKKIIVGWGADLVGLADVALLEELDTDPPNLLEPFSTAISIAIQLPVSVFEMISDQPTPIYSSVYRTANGILDEIAFRTCIALQNDGFYSVPIPASQMVDKEKLCAAISHKAVARMAGLGWQGKNLLLITQQYGSRVRLITVLTEAPLEIDATIENRCGNCMLCREACPAGAIKGISTKDHYKDRNEALHFSRCVEKLKGFSKIPEIGAPICGICIKVCPFGKKVKKKKEATKREGQGRRS